MKLVFHCLLAIFFHSSFSIFAQELTREEQAGLNEELKDLKKNPYKWLEIRKEQQNLNNRIAEKQQELDLLKDFFDSLANAEEVSVESLKTLINQKKLAYRKINQMQTVYKIQIGAYIQHSLDRFIDTPPRFFTVEKVKNGLNKYLLGNFVRMEEAKKFNEWINRKGGRSYVVAFIQGKRVPNLQILN